MHNWFERMKKNEAGLTLIELIVVVAIIGVLAWLITPRVLEALKNSKINSAESAANEFLSAMERYGSEYAAYPNDPGDNGVSGMTGTVQMRTLFDQLNISFTKTGSYFDTNTFQYGIAGSNADFCAVVQAVQDNGGNDFVWIGKQGVFWGNSDTTAPTELSGCPTVN